MWDKYTSARLALDAATEADRAIRGRPSRLGDFPVLADVLEAAWADADPLDVMDMMHLLPEGAPRPETVSELGVAIGGVCALLRRAGAGERDALEPGMRLCLRIHMALLTQGMRDFQPFGLAA